MEYILTIGMMLGLRVAVGRQANPLVKPDLTVEDFYLASTQIVTYLFVYLFRVAIHQIPNRRMYTVLLNNLLRKLRFCEEFLTAKHRVYLVVRLDIVHFF